MEKGLINRLYTSYMKKKNLFLDSSTNRMKTSYNSPNGFQRDRMLTRSDCHFPRFENEKNIKENIMQVILKKDVQNLGEAGDVVNVKDGYARNFLFPKNVAELATAGALENREKNYFFISLMCFY